MLLYCSTWCLAWKPPAQLLGQILSLPGKLLHCPVQQGEHGSAHGRLWMMRREFCQIWIHPEASVLHGGSLVSGCCTEGSLLWVQRPLEGEIYSLVSQDLVGGKLRKPNIYNKTQAQQNMDIHSQKYWDCALCL